MIFLRLFSFLTLIILTTSCGDSDVSIPKDVLGKTEMSSLLTDLQLAQATVTLKQISDSLNFSMNDYTNSLLLSKNITREKFDKSITFYSEHPKLLEDVYDGVIDELSKLQSEEGTK